MSETNKREVEVLKELKSLGIEYSKNYINDELNLPHLENVEGKNFVKMIKHDDRTLMLFEDCYHMDERISYKHLVHYLDDFNEWCDDIIYFDVDSGERVWQELYDANLLTEDSVKQDVFIASVLKNEWLLDKSKDIFSKVEDLLNEVGNDDNAKKFAYGFIKERLSKFSYDGKRYENEHLLQKKEMSDVFKNGWDDFIETDLSKIKSSEQTWIVLNKNIRLVVADNKLFCRDKWDLTRGYKYIDLMRDSSCFYKHLKEEDDCRYKWSGDEKKLFDSIKSFINVEEDVQAYYYNKAIDDFIEDIEYLIHEDMFGEIKFLRYDIDNLMRDLKQLFNWEK